MESNKRLSNILSNRINMSKLFFLLIAAIGIFYFNKALAVDKYAVEASVNNQIFIINNEKFTARTYCFSVEEGDEVIFIEGSPYGYCASAKFLNLRTEEICNVWCE